MRGRGLRSAAVAAVVFAIGIPMSACGSGTDAKTGPLSVSPEGSAVYAKAGAEASLLNFGEEASGAELEEAANVVHAYLVARAEENWADACSYLSEHELGEVTLIASQYNEKLAGKDCAEVIHVLLGPEPRGKQYETAEMEAGSLRAARGSGYLFFRNAGTPSMAPMTREDGAWKVDTIFPSPV
jgi:hypothetical protein